MSQWIAKAIGPKGKVIGIDNNENQIKAANRLAVKNNVKNIEFKLYSVYDLDTLKDDFDFIYCRFVLHHLMNPSTVIQTIYNKLNTGGIFAAEEGIVSQAFTYPFTTAWGTERWHNNPKNHNIEGKSSDRNFGIKLYNTMHTHGFKNMSVNLVQPVITTKKQKSLLLLGLPEGKRGFTEAGHTETEWIEYCKQMQALVEDDAAMVAFYQSCQVSGIK